MSDPCDLSVDSISDIGDCDDAPCKSAAEQERLPIVLGRGGPLLCAPGIPAGKQPPAPCEFASSLISELDLAECAGKQEGGINDIDTENKLRMPYLEPAPHVDLGVSLQSLSDVPLTDAMRADLEDITADRGAHGWDLEVEHRESPRKYANLEVRAESDQVCAFDQQLASGGQDSGWDLRLSPRAGSSRGGGFAAEQSASPREQVCPFEIPQGTEEHGWELSVDAAEVLAASASEVVYSGPEHVEQVSAFEPPPDSP